jgi:hypothetical protein
MQFTVPELTAVPDVKFYDSHCQIACVLASRIRYSRRHISVIQCADRCVVSICKGIGPSPRHVTGAELPGGRPTSSCPKAARKSSIPG